MSETGTSKSQLWLSSDFHWLWSENIIFTCIQPDVVPEVRIKERFELEGMKMQGLILVNIHQGAEGTGTGKITPQSWTDCPQAVPGGMVWA